MRTDQRAVPAVAAQAQRAAGRLLPLILSAVMIGCGMGVQEPGFDGAMVSEDLIAPSNLPGRIEAENFKSGGEGVGYHDTTTTNLGGAYRTTGVDLQPSLDVGGGYNVGWVESGEWLAYDLSVQKAGTFTFTARVASAFAGTKSLHLVINGQALPAVSFTDASGWQSWRDLELGAADLSSGAHSIKVVFDTAKVNLDYVAGELLCQPATCASLGDNCGTVSDGCGGTLSCGSCSGTQSCGGGGVAHVCGCTPTTCAAVGAVCGSISNGCGGTISCGSCGGGSTCNAGACVSSSKTVYGASHGPDGAATISLLQPKLIRTYQPGQLSNAKSLSPGTAIHHSSKPNLANLANGVQSEINAQIVEFSAVPDVPGCRATIGHETDNDVGASASNYQGAWRTFLTSVIPAVNAKRTHKLTTVAITTPNPYGNGTMDQWYVAGADEIGCDIYSTSRITQVASYARAKGKPWSMPEYGYSVSSSGTDAQTKARMQNDYAIWSALPNPPTSVLWFNGGSINNLETRPLAAAWWKALTLAN